MNTLKCFYFFFFLFELEKQDGFFPQCLTNHTDVSVSLHPLAPSVPALASGFVSRGKAVAWPPTSFGGSGRQAQALLMWIPWCLTGIELKMLQPQQSRWQDAFPKPDSLF